ncbi:MAG: sulfatase [Planctomycetota bacterium]
MLLRAPSVHVAVLLVLGASPSASPASATDERPPNVLVVFVDDLGLGDLGCYGAPSSEDGGYDTPAIDALAASGVRFTDFYVSQPVCSASRASLLTGCYANRIGIAGALGPRSGTGIAAEETTLAELCRSRGYVTACFGKWHLGHRAEFLPTRHGFDEFHGIPYSHDMWPEHPEDLVSYPPLPLFDGEEVVERGPDPSTFTHDFTRRAVAFVERAAEEERPFLCYLAHPLPHVPLFASEAFRGTSPRGVFGDVLQELDRSVAELVDALERTGQRENTLVLFASDNGPWLSYGDHAGGTAGLREGKGTTFEGGVRVPAIASWPGTIPAGRVQHEPLMTIDVLPTVARVVGAELPRLPIDGRDAWPLFVCEEGARSPHDAYFFWYGDGSLEAVRSGRYKLHLAHGYRTMRGREPGRGGFPGSYDDSVRTGVALFDLVEDPGETADLAKELPEVVAELRALADGAKAELGDRASGVRGSGVREPGRADPPAAVPATRVELLQELGRLRTVEDVERRESEFDALWDALVMERRIPYVEGDEALFLRRGAATSVELVLDGAPSPIAMTDMTPLDLFAFGVELRADVAMTYRFRVDGEEPGADPENPYGTRTRRGDPASIVRMPDHVIDPLVPRRSFVDPPRLVGEGAARVGTEEFGLPWSHREVGDLGDGAERGALYLLLGPRVARATSSALLDTVANLVAAGRVPALDVVVVGGGSGPGRGAAVYSDATRLQLLRSVVDAVEGEGRVDPASRVVVAIEDWTGFDALTESDGVFGAAVLLELDADGATEERAGRARGVRDDVRAWVSASPFTRDGVDGFERVRELLRELDVPHGFSAESNFPGPYLQATTLVNALPYAFRR